MVLRVEALDLSQPRQAESFLALLDHYANDPMGGGEGLGDYARAHLVESLIAHPGFVGGLACLDTEPVGLMNGFLGFSTFAARPLLNIHDLVVLDTCRGRGIGKALLAFAEDEAVRRGCCKLTLEVLSGNAVALRAYAAAGFAPYQLDPAAGQAVFLQKALQGTAVATQSSNASSAA